MRISISPSVHIELNVSTEERTYTIVGPEAVLAMLHDVAPGLPFRGSISSLADTTVPDEERTKLAIPNTASFFAFLYPMKDLHAPKGLPPALSTLLLGGFLYFDAEKQLLTLNGMSLMPSPISLVLKGPFNGDITFTDKLDSNGRLANVTIDQLVSAGFLKFCWVHPDERFFQEDGGELFLGPDPYTHGAFLYVMEGVDMPRYYPVLVEGGATNDSAACLSAKASSEQQLSGFGALFTALQSVFSSDDVVLRENRGAGRRQASVSTGEVLVMHETATMTLTLMRINNLKLSVDTSKGVTEIVGPNEAKRLIYDACKAINHPELELRGTVSPLAEISLALEARGGVGIPDDAVHYAFAYPMGHLEVVFEAFNLVEHPWAFLLLCGGFLYFDREEKLIAINAISLSPSNFTLSLKGPFTGRADFAKELREAGRLAAVTIDGLRAQGFKEVGWVHCSEKLAGFTLGNEPYPHGAFVYKVHGESGSVYHYYPAMMSQKLSLGEQVKQELSGFAGCENSLIQYFATVKENMARVARIEENEQKRMLALIGESKLSAKLTPCKMRILIVVVFLAFLVVNLIFVSIMVSIGHGSDGVYAFFASLTSGFFLTSLTWVPMRETAMVALEESRTYEHHKWTEHLKWIERGLFVGMPLAFAVLDSIVFGTVRSSGTLFMTTHAYVVSLGVVLPLALYCMRRLYATQMLDGLALRSKRAALILVSQQKSTKASLAEVVVEGVEGSKITSGIDAARRSSSSKMESSTPSKGRTGRRRNNIPQVAKKQRAERLVLREKFQKGTITKGELDKLSELAAICIQNFARILLAKVQVNSEAILTKAERLRFFSWPIFGATLINLLGNNILDQYAKHSHRMQTGSLQWLPATFWAMLLVVGLVVIVHDLRKERPPTFSLAHASFLSVVMYPSVLGIFKINRFVYNALSDYLEQRNIELTATICASFNICVTTVILEATVATARLTARKHARAFLLFPMMFFSAAFQHVFFDLRKLEQPVTASWVFMTCIVHTSMFLRNSGVLQPMASRVSNRILAFGQTKEAIRLVQKRASGDPIFVLQYIAEKGILYDLSDVCATGLTPFLVTFFIARDGYFTLYGTGIFLSSCDIYQLWMRFLVLLFIKVVVAKAARTVLARDMRKTILAQRTIHGKSSIAAELITEHQIIMSLSTEEQIKKVRHNLLRKYLASENVDLVEAKSIEKEFDFANLNYRTMWIRMMAKRMFFFAVAMPLQLITIYQANGFVPAKGSTLWDGDQYRYNGSVVSVTSSGMSGTRAGPLGDFEPQVCFVPHNDSLHFDNVALSEVYISPVSMRWMRRRSFPTMLALDPELDRAYQKQKQNDLTCQGEWYGWINHVNSLVRCNSMHHKNSVDQKDGGSIVEE